MDGFTEQAHRGTGENVAKWRVATESPARLP